MKLDVIYNEDCLEGMKRLPDESIDMILTDPPYMISSEVKISRTSNIKYLNRGSNIKYKGKDINYDFGEWDKQWETETKYLEWCKIWLKECVRILKPYKHLIFFFDMMKITPIWKYLETIEMKGRSPLFWLKTNPVPRGRKVDFMKALEAALWFTKGKVKQDYFNWQLGQQLNYVRAAIPQNPRLHPTQKPEKPLKIWIEYLSKEKDIILDPFMGSGTTLVVAKKLNRSYIGYDTDLDSYKVAKKRLARTVYQKEFEF